MSQSINDAGPVVEGDVIRQPLLRPCLCLGLGAFFAPVALGEFALAAWMVLRPGATTPSEGLLQFLIVTGLGNLFGSAYLMRHGFWILKDNPRWIIGAAQLQFVDRKARVRLAIPYSNLAAVELANPRMAASFIGIRLVYPNLLKFCAGGSPLLSRSAHENLGYHWRITALEARVPLAVIVERIRCRVQQWRDAASALPQGQRTSNSV